MAAIDMYEISSRLYLTPKLVNNKVCMDIRRYVTIPTPLMGASILPLMGPLTGYPTGELVSTEDGVCLKSTQYLKWRTWKPNFECDERNLSHIKCVLDLGDLMTVDYDGREFGTP